MIAAAIHPHGPHIDWAALSPLEALIGGSVIVLMVGLLRSKRIREQVVPFLTIVSFGAAIGLTIWQWHHHVAAISGALAMDQLTGIIVLLVAASGIAATLLSWRGRRYARPRTATSIRCCSAPAPAWSSSPPRRTS